MNESIEFSLCLSVFLFSFLISGGIEALAVKWRIEFINLTWWWSRFLVAWWPSLSSLSSYPRRLVSIDPAPPN